MSNQPISGLLHSKIFEGELKSKDFSPVKLSLLEDKACFF
jgi:hypothetical protein